MRLSLGVLVLAAATSAAAQSNLRFHGVLAGRGIYVGSSPSWASGGAGRFDVGAAAPGDSRFAGHASAHLGADWMPLKWLAVHGDAVARLEPSETKGDRAGIVQAYVDVYNDELSLRVGSFWLPTSRENVEPLWTSPYTITYSALNSWIAQEVRPVGADLQYSPNFYVTLGATAFRGNDTMGTVLAGRGWTLGNRVVVYDEELPLPAPSTTTKPVTQDIDDENGYAARIRLQLPERAMIQFLRLDNRAPLTGGDAPLEAWLTEFDLVSASWGEAGPTTVAAEWMRGYTAIGFPGGTFRMDFDTYYALVSHRQGANRFSIRGERFHTRSHRRVRTDRARENGSAWTAAWFRDLSQKLRTGIEYVRAEGDRPGLAPGHDPETGGSMFTFELRYTF